MNPPTLTATLPSKPAGGSSTTTPWPTSNDRTEATQPVDPLTQVGDHRPNPDAAVLVMDAGHEGTETLGRVADGTSPAADPAHGPWGDRVRQTVQRRPITAVATAFALGAVLVRVVR